MRNNTNKYNYYNAKDKRDITSVPCIALLVLDPCLIPVAEGLNYTLKAGLTDDLIYTHGSDISYTCEAARHTSTSSTCDDGSWIPIVECPGEKTIIVGCVTYFSSLFLCQ